MPAAARGRLHPEVMPAREVAVTCTATPSRSSPINGFPPELRTIMRRVLAVLFAVAAVALPANALAVNPNVAVGGAGSAWFGGDITSQVGTNCSIFDGSYPEIMVQASGSYLAGGYVKAYQTSPNSCGLFGSGDAVIPSPALMLEIPTVNPVAFSITS